jgi:exopolysaccharide biosynthesis polyprenyl glycosylphosphotransferase
MLKQRGKTGTVLLFFADAGVCTLAFFFAYWIRIFLQRIAPLPALYPITVYVRLLYIIIPLFSLCCISCALYELHRFKGLKEQARYCAKGVALFLISLSCLTFFLKIQFLSRTFFLLFGAFLFLLLLCERVGVHQFLRWARRKGQDFRFAIIVADDGEKLFSSVLQEEREFPYKIISFTPFEEVEKLPKILEEEVVDEVFFLPKDMDELKQVEECIKLCQLHGVRTFLYPYAFLQDFSSAYIEKVGGKDMFVFESGPSHEMALFAKRCMDILGSLTLLIVLSPIFLFIMLFIKLTSPGPAIFKQKRVGLFGREFWMLKFRTMIKDAESLLPKVRHLSEVDGPVFKIKNDPRITKIGSFLRRYSLDELPQLLNVLCGDMSLVGPRPPLKGEVEKYNLGEHRRLSMRPGLTCIWQISGRSNLSFSEWMCMDLKYIDNWSLWLDIKLLFKTLPAIIKRVGAY